MVDTRIALAAGWTMLVDAAAVVMFVLTDREFAFAELLHCQYTTAFGTRPTHV
jgi:hypothetical protein